MWTDLFNGKKYIGSHNGDLDDGYVSSGLWMNRAYAKRPHQFRREILACALFDSLEDQLLLEQYFLDQYQVATNSAFYNLKAQAAGGNGVGSNGKLKGIKRKGYPIGEKTSKGRTWIMKDGKNKRVKEPTRFLENGWKLGRTTQGSKGKEWFYDPKTRERLQCFDGEQPSHFMKGFLPPVTWKNRKNNTRKVMTPEGEFATVQEAANYWKVTPKTMIQWLKRTKTDSFYYMERS
jgi:hypothetical protein